MTPKSTHNTHSATLTPLWFNTALSTVVVMATLVATALPISAHSADAASKSTHKATAQQAKKKGSLKIKHQRSPSEETTAERDRRLTRECKGAPNAGACLGYTRK